MAIEKTELQEKITRHKNICLTINDLYAKKNFEYGDSFAQTLNKRGFEALLIVLESKLNRLEALVEINPAEVNFESVEDTLMDIANYCIMTLSEISVPNPVLSNEEAILEVAGTQEETAVPKKKSKKGKYLESLKEYSKKELAEVLKALGGKASKKANKEILVEALSSFKEADIEAAIESTLIQGKAEDAEKAEETKPAKQSEKKAGKKGKKNNKESDKKTVKDSRESKPAAEKKPAPTADKDTSAKSSSTDAEEPKVPASGK